MMADGNTGAYTTAELLGWFRGVVPERRAREDEVNTDLPVMGKVREEFMEKEYGAAYHIEGEVTKCNRVLGAHFRSNSDEDDLDAPLSYEPRYNLKPEEDTSFAEDDDEDLGQGKPTNPNAKPGDHDYAIDESLSAVYDDFSFTEDRNPRLPVHDHQAEILDTIRKNKVTVIQGATGSGKTTQVPQFLLQEHVASRRSCNIICTQPRRIAAKTVAQFVSKSRGWSLGSLVGYQIGMDKKMGELTRLLFVTTGVLLEKLVNQRNMNQYTHVILDEVHERDKDTDFCLLVVRKLLRSNSPHVKVILMSATFETDYYANYYSMHQHGSLLVPPIIKVGESPHPVHLFYLDDIRRLGECEPLNLENPRLNQSVIDIFKKLLEEFDRIEESDPTYGTGDFCCGTVLVFLPGLPEILEVKDALGTSLHLTKLLLHSSITWEEQFAVFHPPEVGKRKVILATNIAESSITIPDIKYVVDFCLVKQLMCDWTTKYCSLRTVCASKASLKQRMGRAGRVSMGRCYRLITKDFFGHHIPDHSIPEMQRCPIESVVLKCKKLAFGDPCTLLRQALQPPHMPDIKAAILTLKEVGAITVLLNGIVNCYDGQMTFVGMIMESLPVDIKLGKLLILGHAFGCLGHCLVIAAALSLKSFFVISSTCPLDGFRSKKSWDETCTSDCLAMLTAYQTWYNARQKVGPGRVRQWEKGWCKRHFLNPLVLREVEELIRELKKRLQRFNIEPTSMLQRRLFEDPTEILLLKVVLAGAFYPNYLSMGELDEETSMKMLSGHNPSTTVMLNGLPENPDHYADQLCSIFDTCGKGKRIVFEAHKAFVEFESGSSLDPLTPAPSVLGPVYLALYMRCRRRRISVQLIDEHAHSRRAVLPSAEDQETISTEVPSPLPPLKLPSTGLWQIFITSVSDPGHFWVQFSDLKTRSQLDNMMQSISLRPLSPLVMDCRKMPGVYCLAKYSADGNYYRAKIVSVNTADSSVEVFFVDYGNSERVPFICLCVMSAVDQREPPQAVRCCLAGVKPVLTGWSDMSSTRFIDLVEDKHLMAHVYSEVDGVLRIELYDTNQKPDLLINSQLVEEGHALKCTEPYVSRVNHAQAISSRSSEASSSSLLRSALDLDLPVEHIQVQVGKLGISCKEVKWIRHRRPMRGFHSHASECHLKGPSSPYEVSFHSMMSNTGQLTAKVQQDSVNTIVINTEPQEKHQKMMVAAHVALNPAGSSYVVRDTTLLPPVPGLPHLLCLLFAPSAEMRCDELKRQYVGVLCGLGYDPDLGQSIFPEHDMEVMFDTLITPDDLDQVNRIRTAVNLVLEADNLQAEWGLHAARKIQKNIREMVKDLILKPRASIPPYFSGKRGWNQLHPNDILHVEATLEASIPSNEEVPPLYQMIDGIHISGERIDMQRSTKVLLKRRALEKLKKDSSSGMLPASPVECLLCRCTCLSPADLSRHFRSSEHQAREKSLYSDDLERDSVTSSAAGKKTTAKA